MSQKNTFSTPASDEPVYEIDSFELLWEQHKTSIIGAIVAIVVIFVGVFGWMIISHSQRVAAENAFATSKTPQDYQAVIEKYPSSLVAGDAALLLAKSLRDEKKYDEANKVLDQFVQAQPKHPFAPLAKVAEAENLALVGKFDDAEKALDAIAQTDSASFAAPYALLLEAQLKSTKGQRDAALTVYRQLKKSFPESTATRASGEAAEAIEAMSPAAAPAPTAP